MRHAIITRPIGSPSMVFSVTFMAGKDIVQTCSYAEWDVMAMAERIEQWNNGELILLPTSHGLVISRRYSS
jgi:hypothetical protein